MVVAVTQERALSLTGLVTLYTLGAFAARTAVRWRASKQLYQQLLLSYASEPPRPPHAVVMPPAAAPAATKPRQPPPRQPPPRQPPPRHSPPCAAAGRYQSSNRVGSSDGVLLCAARLAEEEQTTQVRAAPPLAREPPSR